MARCDICGRYHCDCRLYKHFTDKVDSETVKTNTTVTKTTVDSGTVTNTKVDSKTVKTKTTVTGSTVTKSKVTIKREKNSGISQKVKKLKNDTTTIAQIIATKPLQDILILIDSLKNKRIGFKEKKCKVNTRMNDGILTIDNNTYYNKCLFYAIMPFASDPELFRNLLGLIASTYECDNHNTIDIIGKREMLLEICDIFGMTIFFYHGNKINGEYETIPIPFARIGNGKNIGRILVKENHFEAIESIDPEIDQIFGYSNDEIAKILFFDKIPIL